jgi:hypothetical protein
MVVASGTESPSGTLKSPPTIYHILSKDFAFVSTKKSNPRAVAGQPFPVLPWRGMEESTAQLGILPICEGNGLGEALVRFFGSDDCDKVGDSLTYNHLFAWENLPLTATYYMSYGNSRYEKVRMMGLDSIAVECKNSGELSIDGVLKGADMSDSNISEYGTEDLVDLAEVNQLTGLGARLEWGQPGAAIRTGFENVKLELKRNITMSLPGKDGQHPAGSGSPRACSSKNSDAKLTIDFWDVDGEELKRWRQGGNTTPTATRQTDASALVKARYSIFGPAIEQTINGEADYLNIGETVAAFAGTYSGGDTVTVGEIIMGGANCYETALGSNKDLAFHWIDALATYTVAIGEGGQVLACAVVGKDITITTAAAGNTAAAILAKLLATPAAVALMDFALAPGSSGAGTITVAQSKIDIDDAVDGFKFRYTTGANFGSWSSWNPVTKEVAQDLVSGITVEFADDDTAESGDYFYFCSHERECLRFTLPNMNIDTFTDKVADGVYKGHLEASHTSADEADRPFAELTNLDASAYA